jgi:hypothetical protein
MVAPWSPLGGRPPDPDAPLRFSLAWFASPVSWTTWETRASSPACDGAPTVLKDRSRPPSADRQGQKGEQ